MFSKLTFIAALALTLVTFAHAEEHPDASSPELQILKVTVGIWDASIEVWPTGLDAPSIKFKGVETNEAYGQHWISSDFISEIQGTEIKVHTIVGYDLDQKKFIGIGIDHGPYASQMTGDFNSKTKTIHWTTKVKSPDGKLITQKTSVTYKGDNKRHLVMKTRRTKDDEFKKFMVIHYTKRD